MRLRRFSTRELPGRGPDRRRQAGVLTGLLLLGSIAHAAKPDGPVFSIPLQPLGFLGAPPRLLMGAATLFTLHFVDATHLLFTYTSRGLITRLPDARPEDDDRNVTAVLLELPSGKVLARTEWRMRDHGQYLWPLGQGRFLLRIRTRLSVIDPLRRLAGPEPFRQHLFADPRRTIGFVSVSPGGDLVSVETVPRPKPRPVATNVAAAALGAAGRPAAAQAAAPDAVVDATTGVEDEPVEEEDRRVPVRVHFYRMKLEPALETPKGEPERVVAQSSGIIFSPALVNLPVTAEGYLNILKESPTVYNFDFHSHTGKKAELAAYDTSCTPRPFFVSRSEFVAFGCRGSADRSQLAAFNLRGENPWVQTFNDSFLAPEIVGAFAGGRFALSRLVVANGLIDGENLTPEMVTAQEITVRQTFDGRLLLKTQAVPYQRSGQNFDLTADGLQLAIVRAGNIEVYRLPPLTAKDVAEVKRAAAAEPERNTAAILFGSVPVVRRKEAAAEGVPVGAEVLRPETAEQKPTPAKSAPPRPAGDDDSAPRKAPSLYDAEHPKPPSL